MGNQICTCGHGEVLEFPQAEFDALGFRKLSPAVQKVLQEKKPFQGKVSKSWTTMEYDGDIYQGKVDKNNKPDGYGRMFKKDGSYFIGKFSNGKAHGEGFYITQRGHYYEGKFDNNQAKDKNGKFVAENTVYEGNFEHNQFDGKGKQNGQNYSFQGTYENGLKKEGKLKWKQYEDQEERQFQYEGQFENNQFSGFGILKNNLGTYKGNFRKGLKDGKGRFQFNTGMVYIGDYLSDRKEGNGIVYKSNGKIAYEGEMKNSLPNGKGTFYTKDDEKIESQFIDGIQAQYISKADRKILQQKKDDGSRLRASTPRHHSSHRKIEDSQQL